MEALAELQTDDVLDPIVVGGEVMERGTYHARTLHAVKAEGSGNAQ